MDMGKLASAYIKIRDAKSALNKDHKVKEDKLKSQLKMLENQMLKFMNENNTDSLKTEAGTMYRQMDVMPSGANWAEFYAWVRENDAFDALQRRVNKGFITTYMEENEGKLPPGISVHREYVCRVRTS